MGLLFVIFFHFIAVFILSLIIGIVAVIITYFLSKGEKKKRKLFFAFIAPFIGFFSLYIFAFLGSIFVSEIKNVDIGVGDAWYVPLKDDYQLLFIDIPDYGSIYKLEGGEAFVSDIAEIEQRNDLILGRTSSNQYFSFNLKSQELNVFDDERRLTVSVGSKKLNFVKVYDFYSERRNEIAGSWFIIVGIVSLFVSCGILYVLRKILLLNFKIKK